MDKKLVEKYAEFAVLIGTNPRPEQTLIINCPVTCHEFAQMCTKVAYEKANVKEVVVNYHDEKIARLKFEHTDLEVLKDIKPWRIKQRLDYLESEGQACFLHIISDNPEIFKGLDTDKIDKARSALSKAFLPAREYTMKDKVQWSIVAIPSESWAQKVFPNENKEDAVEKLWKAIFDVCRVTNGNPVAEWKEHVKKLTKWRNAVNEMNLESIHMTSSNGTDLTVGLAEGAIWEGADSKTPKGYDFIANIPTEEIFTAPHKDRVDGIVYGTKPYVYNGNVIKDFMVKFKNGKVVDFSAKEGEELLKQLLDTDEGSKSIGEIALVPVSSPINKKNILFYDTLFDENAACHIAFGEGYPGTVKGGKEMTKEELLEKGVNQSLIHEDVMVGSFDMKIVGKTKDGKDILIFKDGEWAF